MGKIAFIRLAEVINRKQDMRVVSVTVKPTIADCSGTIYFTDLMLQEGPALTGYTPHTEPFLKKLRVDGEVKAGPVSSIVGFYIVNSMMLAACEELDRRGIKPPVFKSGNVSGGDRYNAEMVEKYLPRVRHL